MVFMIIGGIVIVIGVILLVVKIYKQKALYALRATEKITIEQLSKMTKGVADEIGGGAFNYNAKISGKIICDSPLVSQLAKRECVSYSYEIQRKYEEQVEVKDSQTGNITYRWETRYETVSSNSESIDFFIDDGTGKIGVSYQGCDMDTIQVLDDFVPSEDDRLVNIGDFSLNLPALFNSSTRRTVGYRYTERIVPVNVNALIVGMATDDAGFLKLRKQNDKNMSYFLSLKDETELTQDIKSTINGLNIGFIISLIVGIVLILIAIITKFK